MFWSALSLALMYADHHYPYLNQIRYYLGTVTYSVHSVIDLPIRAWEWSYNQIWGTHLLERENTELKRENMLLNLKLQKFSALLEENKRLNRLLKSASRHHQKRALVAKLTATNYTPFRQHVVINKGTRHNVYIGQPILDEKGIMGQVISVTPFSATGMLISDPSHSVLVQVGELGIRGLLAGTGNPKQLKLEYLPLDINVQVGDRVITSGLDERYPPDYPIGTVTKVDRNSSTFAKVHVAPYADLDHGREVLLVWDTPLAEKHVSQLDPEE